jgi:uncharacterized peroxidase-related enzyme
MSRLHVVDPATAEGPVKEVFDGPLKGKELNIFKGMANSPAGLHAYLGLAGALGHGSLSQVELEAIALAIAEVNNCDYCRAAHTAIGTGAGMSEAQTISARRGSFADDPKLDALVKFAVRIHEKHGFVSDEDLATFKKAGFTDAHVVDVIVAYALNIYTNTFNHVNDTAIDFPQAPALK